MKKLNPNTPIKALIQIRKDLDAQIVGQSDALDGFIRVWTREVGGMRPKDRPIGSLVFAGPTGVGKTAAAYAIARAIDGNVPLRIDCGEFQHGHEVAKLIGAPPGYLGHKEESAILTQANLLAHGDPAVVLFDEIEKAHVDLHELLLGVLDYGGLTTGDNRKVQFNNTVIVFTSNAASDVLVAGSGGWGFKGHVENIDVRRTLRDVLGGPFMGRVDEVVAFQPLKRRDAQKVLEMELVKVAEQAEIVLDVEKDVIDKVLREGYTMRFGVRDLQRVIGQMVVEPIARLRALKTVVSGDRVLMKVGKRGEMEFWKQAAVGG